MDTFQAVQPLQILNFPRFSGLKVDYQLLSRLTNHSKCKMHSKTFRFSPFQCIGKILRFRKFKDILKKPYEMERNCGTIADILITILPKLPTGVYLLLLLVRGSSSENCLRFLFLRAGCL